MMGNERRPRTMIGWREYLHLPDVSDVAINAKIDTGARTSALHAIGLRVVEIGDHSEAQFELHPLQNSADHATTVVLPVHRFRKVRSSNGRSEIRPTIVTTARIGDVVWPIELTLTSRDEMGFRMLIGRAALRNRFTVNPSRSYLLGAAPIQENRNP